jgi:hypothetical protein
MAVNKNAQTVFNALRAKGYSSAAAAGAVGNLMQESNVNPGSVEKGNTGAGRGIAQWGTGAGSGGRWETEGKWAANRKLDRWALGTQIGFLDSEMRARGIGPGSSYAKTTSVSGATGTFERVIEQAGIVVMGQRIGYAQTAYNQFSGLPVVKTPSATKAPAGGSVIPGIHNAPIHPRQKGPGAHPRG